jgi:hypothetical protein
MRWEHANIDRLIYLLVRWFSTAAEMCGLHLVQNAGPWAVPHHSEC